MRNKRLKLLSIFDYRSSIRRLKGSESMIDSITFTCIFLILIAVAFAVGTPSISVAEEAPAESGEADNLESNPFIIKSIEIQGSKTMPPETILSIIQTKVGEEVSLKQIREDVKVLYKFGQFSNIQVNSSGSEDGISLTFVLEEWPKVDKLDLKGNEKISSGKIDDVLTIEAGNSLSGKLLHENEEKITSLYKKKGYYLAQVESKTRPKSEGSVDVLFNISEGQKIEVEEIDIMGNRRISDREIRKKMKIKKGKRFDDKYFEGDLIAIEQHYRENGFINAKIISSGKEFNEDKTGLIVRIEVEEGQQFRVGAIKTVILPNDSGEPIFEEKKILKAFTLTEGDIFSEAALNEGVARISNMYFDKGRVAVKVEPEEEYDMASETVDLKLTISEGGAAYIDSVQINWISETDDEPHKSKDYIIKRELEQLNIKSGELFSYRNIRDARRKILRLGPFIRNCNPVARPQLSSTPDSESNDQKVVVNFEIEESPQSGMFSIAGGYGSEGGIFGALDIWDDNIMGRAWRLRLRGEIGTRERRTGEISFSSPWIFGTPTSLGLSLYSRRRSSTGYYSTEEEEDDVLYKDESLGASVTIGRPITRNIDLSVGLKNENVSYQELVGEDWEETYKGKTRSVKLMLDRDTRQFLTSMFDPNRGSYNTFSAEFSGLGGDTFQKYITDSSLFIPTWWKLVLVFHLRTGYFTGEYPTVQQLRYERFYLGGINSIRGYGLYSITPPGDYEEIGGNQMAFLNVEYRFPITNVLRGLLFFDAGQTWADNEWPWDRFSPKKSIGMGLRIDLMGALARLEYGYPLDGGREHNWHFDIGPSF